MKDTQDRIARSRKQIHSAQLIAYVSAILAVILYSAAAKFDAVTALPALILYPVACFATFIGVAGAPSGRAEDTRFARGFMAALGVAVLLAIAGFMGYAMLGGRIH